MKKICITLVALFGLLVSPSLNAQTLNEYCPDEISASYGISVIGIAMNSLINIAGSISIIADAFSEEEIESIRSGGSKGVLNLGYIHHFNRVFGVGANAGFNRMSVKLEDKTGSLTAASANIMFLMADAKLNWFRYDNFGMYSKFGLGVMCINGNLVETMSGNLWLPTGHVSLIGMEFGGQFCGFMELGAGMQGVAQFGLKYHF